ncbi:MAG: winged helix-turn-helix domain-containing protein, partial [Pseudonocardia sp.]|nr:winged helix-turn-helix domain-containing protein [Pseudonocardia sp.]
MRIGVLGTVAAWPAAPNGALPNGGGPDDLAPNGLRVRGLLARLALDPGRPVTADTLVDALWGDEPPDGAGNALQSLVSRLRRALGPDLVTTVGGGYLLRVPPDDVDALRFTRLTGFSATADPQAARGLLTEALGLWRGPALADVRRLPFADAAAERLAEQRAVAVERLAAVSLDIGSPGDGLDALTSLLAEQPLRESAAAVLARSLHAVGRQADALAVLDRTGARLVEELGVDPGPELRRTRIDVLRTQPSLPTAKPARPAAGGALTSFVGRREDVPRVRELLGSARLVTLIGPGGAGKTRLAREAFGDAVLAELAPLTGGDQLPATLLGAVGGPEMVVRTQDENRDTATTTERLVATLGSRDVLLILDNCEHVIDAVATLAETLLAACPRLRVLATSREPLAVPGEVLHPVSALAVADAVRLFTDRAVAVAPGFTPDADAVAAIAEICRRLDGQPLPIELAAARLRTLTPREILTRLDDRFRLLTTGARTALPRHQTLRAVVDWSWDLLGESERIVTRRLAVFAGGATAEAAERVCSGAGGPASEEVFEILASLVDKSLVVAAPQPDGAPTRYRMLETIREYAGERLGASGERDALVAAHAAWVLDLVEAAEPELRGADQLPWLARLRAEAGNVTGALRRAVAEGDAPVAYRLVAGASWSWVISGLVLEATHWAREVAALPADGVPPGARALTLAYLAISSIGEGDVAGATRLLDEATALVHVLAVGPDELHPLLRLLEPVSTAFVKQDVSLVERVAEEARDPWLRATALEIRSMILENDGQIERQRELVRAAHALYRRIGDRFGLGMTLTSLGELEEVTGNPEAAAAAYDEAITLATELGNTDDLPQFMVRRAQLAARAGDAGRARELLGAARRITRPSFEPGEMLRVSEADIERRAGNLDGARRALAGVDLARDAGLALPQRRALLAVARAQLEMDSAVPAAAAAPLAEAAAAAVESADGPVAGRVCEGTARYAWLAGEPQAAAALLGVAT